MKVFASRTVELSFTCLAVDSHSRFSTACVKPKSDVSASSLDEGSGEGIGDTFLNDVGEVVDFPKEGDPAVVGSVVLADFFNGVVPLFGRGNR